MTAHADVFTRATCRLCDSRDLDNVMPFLPSAIADQYVTADKRDVPQPVYGRDAYLCRDCGHLQLLDVVNPELLFRDYIYRTSTSLGLRTHFAELAQTLIDELDVAPDSLVLEIGSNEGCLLEEFRARHMRVIGADPARAIAALAEARGIHTLPEFFTPALAVKIAAEWGSAKLVCANNVFAHIDDMHGAAEAVAAVLAPDGAFVFEVVYVGDLLDNFLFDTIYHEHLSTHALTPLEGFLQRHGLELFDAYRVGSKGGSMRVFAQPAGTGRYTRRPRVDEMLAAEKARGITKAQTYRDHYAQIIERKTELRAVLDAFRGAGKRIAGYGAAPATTTLLYEFEIAEYLACIFDDNALKQGRLSPGHHLEVAASDQIAARKIDVIVILAWTYAKPIIERLDRFVAAGGTCVIPLPNLRILAHNPSELLQYQNAGRAPSA